MQLVHTCISFPKNHNLFSSHYLHLKTKNGSYAIIMDIIIDVTYWISQEPPPTPYIVGESSWQSNGCQ